MTGLLFYWRELLHEDKSLLKLRLSRAGVNFDLLLSNIPAGQSVNVTRNTVLGKLHKGTLAILFQFTQVPGVALGERMGSFIRSW